MSRSYKKTPSAGGNYTDSKRRASKKVRRLLKDRDIKLTGAEFRKCYCSWDIKDYFEIAPSFNTFYKDQVRRWAEGRIVWWKDKNNPPTREACFNTYCKWYRRK